MTLLCHFFFDKNASVYLRIRRRKMSCYFLVQVFCSDQQKRVLYDEYIHDVKPIVESYGGKYLIRSENLISLS